jgi:arsenite-transporting ATPase
VLGADNPLEDNALFQSLAGSLPGIDEAMSFAEVMKQVQTMQFDVIVFDTAPTGHTLRFLSFPSVLANSLSKIISVKSKFSFLFQQVPLCVYIEPSNSV